MNKYELAWKELEEKAEAAEAIVQSNWNELPILHDLLIVAEDHRVMSHKGVDLLALCRAVWRTCFCGRREGGSTIAMQLVRVLSGRYEKRVSRKILEIYLAVKLTDKLSVSEILNLYLSVAYYGWNMHGIKQAAGSLDINPQKMTIHQGAGLIARLKYPEPRYPNSKRAKQIGDRTNYIVDRYLKDKECVVPWKNLKSQIH